MIHQCIIYIIEEKGGLFVFVDAVYEYKKNTWFHAKEKGISTSLS